MNICSCASLTHQKINQMNLVIAKPSVLNHSILLQMSYLLQKHAATASKVSLIALACLTLVASPSAANSKLESNNPFLPFGHTPPPQAQQWSFALLFVLYSFAPNCSQYPVLLAYSPQLFVPSVQADPSSASLSVQPVSHHRRSEEGYCPVQLKHTAEVMVLGGAVQLDVAEVVLLDVIATGRTRHGAESVLGTRYSVVRILANSTHGYVA